MPPDAIIEGVAEINDIPEIEILRELHQRDGDSRWTVKIRLSPENLNQPSGIPEETDWYVRIDDTYPGGKIGIYPAKENGITETHPHQTSNTSGELDKPWRNGNICVERYTHSVGRTGGSQEPFDAKDRLRWYILRAVSWLELASNGELRQEGEPYELPAFSNSTSQRQFAYNETRSSFQTWSELTEKYGLTYISKLKNSDVRVAVDFLDLGGDSLYTPNWGDIVETEKAIPGIWWLLDEPPIKPPWEVPSNWENLANFLSGIDENVFRVLAETREANTQASFSYILLGFPIPEYIGEDDAIIHWQAIGIEGIPDISDFKGFRDTTRNRVSITRKSFKYESITWLESDNWAQEQLARRGKLDEKLRESNIMLLGAGALGSIVAENLLRDGCTNITIVDGDKFEIGNLARHTLTLDAINQYKATALAERLRDVSPHATIHKVKSRYPLSDSDRKEIPDPDIILDCTGNDQVLYALDREHWDSAKLVVSTSLGLKGIRLYTYATYTHTFDFDDFEDQIKPWALQDLSIHRPDENIIPERVGCWHPASVITMNTIATWGGIVPELIEESAELGIGQSLFEVLEKSRKQNSVSVQHRDEPFLNAIKWRSGDGKSLELPRNCLEEMIEFFQSDSPNETGGILTGRYTDETNGRIIRTSDPPPDSIQSPTTFLRGTEEVNKSLKEVRERYGLYYLGEWHTHPGKEPTLSEQDVQEMQSIANNESYKCPNPFLIIIGGNGETGFVIKPYLFHRNKNHDELTPAFETCQGYLETDTTTRSVVYNPGDPGHD